MKTLIGLLALAGFGFAVSMAEVQNHTPLTSGGEFDRIYFKGAATFNLTQGEVTALTLTADDEVLDVVTVDVADGVLYIEVEDDDVETRELRVDVTVVDLAEFVSAGSISLVGTSLEVDDLVVDDSGAGSYRFEGLKADELNVSSSGAARFDIAGAVRRQVVDLTGAGRYQAKSLRSETSEVSLKGAGSAEVWVDDHLDVQIAGAGRVTYEGEPVVNKRVSGAGSVVSALN